MEELSSLPSGDPMLQRTNEPHGLQKTASFMPEGHEITWPLTQQDLYRRLSSELPAFKAAVFSMGSGRRLTSRLMAFLSVNF